MWSPPELHTPRLLLRVPNLSDLDRWAELMADADSTRFIGGVQPRSMVWRGLMAMIGAWHETGVSMFSLIAKSTGQWLGRVGPWSPDGWPGNEVGWALHPDAHDRGFAFEAACVCMDYAVDVLGWTDIMHSIDPENRPSQQLAERLGSRLRGPGKLPAPHHDVPVELWGQSAHEWRERRNTPVKSGS
jgi:RimJ/RimL family protein N-acetyltransferase